jgi:prepilin-type processing-associated H-X9-DG protein
LAFSSACCCRLFKQLANLKQIGLAVHNFESANRKLPNSGQWDSTGGASTIYFVHSTPTQLLPYLEQNAVYQLLDHSADPRTWPSGPATFVAATPGNDAHLAVNGARLHPNAKGLPYDHPANVRPTGSTLTNGQIAGRARISAFECPSSPVSGAARDPQYGYGGIDYMFIASSDIYSNVGNLATPAQAIGTRVSTGAAYYLAEKFEGMLGIGKNIGAITDGTSNTLLNIEDAGRAAMTTPPSSFSAGSSRPTPSVGALDPAAGDGLTTGARRVHAWIDADAATNGFSGPSNAVSPASRVARINNYASPVGGPPECRWTVNNCGPNDEPFAFHTGGVNAVMGDGSVRFMSAATENIVVKNMIGASDGTIIQNQE